MAEFLPVMLKTTELPCLVVGGGKVALRKVLAVLRFGMRVTVVAEDLTPGLRKLVKRRWIRWRQRKFSPVDLFRMKMVIAATNDPRVNRKVIRWARWMNLYYNTVDNMELSNFIFPAVYCSGALTVAVSTQGYYPAAARKIKQEFAQNYGVAYREYFEKLRRYRERIKSTELNPRKRRAILNHLLNVSVETLNRWSDTDFGVWLEREQK